MPDVHNEWDGRSLEKSPGAALGARASAGGAMVRILLWLVSTMCAYAIARPPGLGRKPAGTARHRVAFGMTRVDMSEAIEIWDLWFPNAASQGLPFARGRLDATAVLLVHAAPDVLRAEVSDDAGRRLARADELRRTAETPIARLTRRASRIEREDIWPDAGDLGRPVILPGGEVGTLTAWWNDERKQEWRWSIQLYNHR